MASVSSLDKDMRNIRLSKYTPQAANEVRTWIEEVLGERLSAGDLLDALKDGTALCKLVNLAAAPGVRFKSSSMPFVQMENISHFLRACQQPPLNLQSHDIFQTVDLYESKDPAQVLQCISSFSRRAHAVQPSKFPSVIGEKSKGGIVSPQSTGGYSAGYGRPRGISNTSETSSTPSYSASHAIGGRGSPSRLSETGSSTSANGAGASSGVSSWSKKGDEGATMPAWNIHQYGYMGGASQGNQGISFGGRRQITTPGPKVPSLAEKERKRREQEAETDRLRVQAEEAENKRRIERQAEEERDRVAEEQRWEIETRRTREKEKLRVEEEKHRWEEEERRWKLEEEARIREEKEADAKLERETQQKPGDGSRPKLQGQYLSQYKAEQAHVPMKSGGEDPERIAERQRVKDLERQLAEAKERETRYESERQERLQTDQIRERSQQAATDQSRARSRSRPRHPPEEQDLRHQWPHQHAEPELPDREENAPPQPPRPLPEAQAPPPQPPRPLPSPLKSESAAQPAPSPSPSPPLPSTLPPRPLPNPANYTTTTPNPPSPIRKSPFARPSSPAPTTTSPIAPPPQPTPHRKPPFANPSSLLSREMELDRARQQEWEESQRATKEAAGSGVREGGTGPGDGAWDTSQYGYLGGDGQNRGGTGIGFGGRRQLVGPREPKGK